MEPLLKEFSKLSAFDEVIDDDSVEMVFFFVVFFTDFLTDFFTTVVSDDSMLSTADYTVEDKGNKRKKKESNWMRT